MGKFWDWMMKDEPVQDSSLEIVPTPYGTAIRIRFGNLPPLEIKPRENKRNELMLFK